MQIQEKGKGGKIMATPLLTGLRNLREDLLRQLLLTRGAEKTEILVKIMEMEDLIAHEERTAPVVAEPVG